MSVKQKRSEQNWDSSAVRHPIYLKPLANESYGPPGSGQKKFQTENVFCRCEKYNFRQRSHFRNANPCRSQASETYNVSVNVLDLKVSLEQVHVTVSCFEISVTNTCMIIALCAVHVFHIIFTKNNCTENISQQALQDSRLNVY